MKDCQKSKTYNCHCFTFRYTENMYKVYLGNHSSYYWFGTNSTHTHTKDLKKKKRLLTQIKPLRYQKEKNIYFAIEKL